MFFFLLSFFEKHRKNYLEKLFIQFFKYRNNLHIGHTYRNNLHIGHIDRNNLHIGHIVFERERDKYFSYKKM